MRSIGEAHPWPCAGHARLASHHKEKTWMTGTSPATKKTARSTCPLRSRTQARQIAAALVRQFPHAGARPFDQTVTEQILQRIGTARSIPVQGVRTRFLHDAAQAGRVQRYLDKPVLDAANRRFAVRIFGKRGQNVEGDAHDSPGRECPGSAIRLGGVRGACGSPCSRLPTAAEILAPQLGANTSIEAVQEANCNHPMRLVHFWTERPFQKQRYSGARNQRC